VMAEGFPDRMAPDFKSATEVMFELGRYGQKNDKGFFEYSEDKRGKPQKNVNQDVYNMIADVVSDRVEFEREDIIARMMLPMAIEMARCVEEGIVGSPGEADLALLFGVGFPPFRGGIFRWMDTVGMAHLAEASAKFAHLGKAYELTERMQEMLANGETYY
jgi:3-hydroxyacyl-CoA dehydrogenase/enoyl-CoA hydratase/3-hydroxybutyryl-CoA epimerase/enoyl-CoA isomerase